MRIEGERPELPSSFMLGPFEVRVISHLDYPENYILFIIFADGIVIRKQISYPEEADGHYGLAFTLDQDQELTQEDRDKLLAFKNQEHASHAFGRRRVRVIK